MKNSQRLSRRTVLRGLGVSVALPLLEAMRPAPSLARPAGDEHKDRPAAHGIPLRPERCAHARLGSADRSEPDFELPAILEPLAAVKDDLLILSGLSLNPARALGDGGGDHARAMASFLTGCHPRKTDGADLRAGISVDQVAAQRIGQATRFPSLEIGCEGGRSAGECDHGYSCAYQSNLSWRSETTPVAKEINPRLVFDRLFGSPLDGGNGADVSRGDRQKKSILDFVSDDARPVAKRRWDRPIAASWMNTSPRVRELEQRIARSRSPMDLGVAKYPRPLGIPADYQEHLRLDGRPARTGVSERPHSRRDLRVRQRWQQPQLSERRRFRRPPRPLTSRRRPSQAGEDQENQPVPHSPPGIHPREDEEHPRRRWHLARPLL